MGIANIIPSIRSSIPPCPGNKSLVFLTLALRFKNEINKSPICDVAEIIKVIIDKVKRSLFGMYSRKKGIKNKEKIKEPIEPDTVLFGLILVNFLPLKVLPMTNPPISDMTDIKIEKIINISKYGFCDFMNKTK